MPLHITSTGSQTISGGLTLQDGVSANLIIRKKAGQTQNLTEWRDENDAIIACIENDGTMYFAQSATVYNDIIISPSNLRGGATPPTFAVFQNNVYQLRFDNGATDIVYGSAEIQHDYAESTPLEVHLHWSPSNTNTGLCQFTFEYTVANMITGVFGTTTTITLTGTPAGVVNQHQYMSGLPLIPGTGRKIGDIIAFVLTRPTGDAFTGDAFVHSVGIHYQCDTLGSRYFGNK